jgi:hypothetical protein
MDKLPDNVIQLTTLKINHTKNKRCTCYESYSHPHKWPSYEIDTQNREIICQHCKAVVEPFEALLKISRRDEKLIQDTEYLLKQARELANYKPWLRSIKSIESNVRNGEMIPCCPHCHQGILLEELNSYTNKARELERRKFK